MSILIILRMLLHVDNIFKKVKIAFSHMYVYVSTVKNV